MRKAGGNPNWSKGVSGNPGGRPKMPRDLVEAARAHSVEMLEVLIKLARNSSTPPTARISAATAILDRGYGKPSVTIETTHGSLDHMSDAELEALIREGLEHDRIEKARKAGDPVH